MAITAAQLMVKVDGDSSGAEDALRKTDKSIAGLAASATKGSAIFGAALAGGLAISAKAGMDFEKSMAAATAIMDVSATEMAGMEAAARNVGKTTTFSASQAGDAFYFLASAGYDAATAIKVLPGVANFAMAGQFDLATATEYLADAQAALGLKTGTTANKMKQMTRVADVLTRANILSNASVEQFSEALTNKAGAALRTVGKDIEEGAALLAVYADQGVKGAEAGEKLYMVTRDLQTAALNNADAFKKAGVAVYDSKGEMRNYADIISDLEKRLGPMTDAQKKAELAALGFTDRSTGALLAVLGTSDAMRKYEQELRKAGGYTDKVAGKQLLNLSDQLTILKGKLMDVGISIYQGLIEPIGAKLVAALGPAVEWLGQFFQNINKVDPAVLGGIAGVIVGALIPAFIALGTAIWSVMAPLLPFIAVGAAVGVAVGLVVKKLGGLAGIKAKLEPARKAWQAFKDGFSAEGFAAKMEAAATPFGRFGIQVKAKLAEAGAAWVDFKAGLAADDMTSRMEAAATPFGRLGLALQTAKQSVIDFATALWSNLAPLKAVFAETFGQMVAAAAPLWEQLKALWTSLKPVITALAVVVGVVLAAAFGQLMGIVNGVARAFAPLLRAVLGVASIVVNVFNLLLGIVTGNGDLIKKAVSGIGKGIVDVFAGLWGAVSGFLTGFVEGIIAFFTGLWETLVGGSIVPDMITAIIEWFAQLPLQVLTIIGTFVLGLVAKFTELATTVLTNVGTFITGLLAKWAQLGLQVLTAVASFVASLVAAYVGLWARIISTVVTFVGNVVRFWATLGARVLGAVATFVGSLLAAYAGLWAKVLGAVGAFIGSLVGAFAGIVGKVSPKLAAFITAAYGKFTELAGKLRTWASETASNVLSWAAGIGRSIADGIKNGVKATWDGLVAKLKGLVDLLPDIVKRKLGISSPSKVFAKFGKAMGDGMTKGIVGTVGKVEAAVGKLAVLPQMGAYGGATAFAGAGMAPVMPVAGQVPAGGATASVGMNAAPQYNFAGATFVVQVPDGRVDTFSRQLSTEVEAGWRRGRMRA